MSLFSKVKVIFKPNSNKKKKIFHNVKLENPEEYWEIIGELGDGAYGKVYKAQHKEKGHLAALKQVLLEDDDDDIEATVEIDILSECKHENIVQLLEAYQYDGKIWMYLEYCDGGSAHTIMIDLDRPLTEPQIAYICKNLCNALQYIHENKVIHRDLKAGNVLLTMDGGVKLADFGVSAKNKTTYEKRGTYIGTPYWMAPEVILCETFFDHKYDYKADIWSLGITLVEFAQVYPPYYEISPVRVLLKIQKADPPKLDQQSKWSKEFNDFLAKCLTKDPVHRPSAAELLKPIRDLILEYKAEVVEEIEEEHEDQRTSRLSLGSEEQLIICPNNTNICPLAPLEENVYISNQGDVGKVKSSEEKENLHTGERRSSKGPAPPPPISTVPVLSKKGPAPPIPVSVSPPKPDELLPTVPNSQPICIVNDENLPTAIIGDSEIISEENSSTVEIDHIVPQTLSSSHSAENESKDMHSSIKEELPITAFSEESSKLLREENKLDKSFLAENNENTLISVANEVNKPDNEAVKEPASIVSSDIYESSINFIEQEINLESSNNSIIVSSEPVDQLQRELNDSKSNDENESVQLLSSCDNVLHSLESITEPLDVECFEHRSSEAVLASISSEGTVIVRTPTPTSSEQGQSISPKVENVVTYSEEESDAVPVTDGKDAPVCHKLDESEVLISNSSMLQDENGPTENSRSRYEITLEEFGESDEDSIKNSTENPAHVSVVAVEDSTLPVSDLSSSVLVSEKSELTEVKNALDLDNTDYGKNPVSLVIEGTTVGATDVDEIMVENTEKPIEESVVTDNREAILQKAQQHSHHVNHTRKHSYSPSFQKKISVDLKRNTSHISDRSDTDSTCTFTSEKEDSGIQSDSNGEVLLRHSRSSSLDFGPKHIGRSWQAQKDLLEKEELEAIALRKKTRKRTRKFVVDGVIVTTTTCKVIYGDDEEVGDMSNAHQARKQELRELKILQRMEQKQFQELGIKANMAKADQEKKFESERLHLLRGYEMESEAMKRHQKQQVEKAEYQQEIELRNLSRKIKAEQECELKAFRNSLKTESRLLKQEIDLLKPKDKRKDIYRVKKDKLEQDQSEREKTFILQQQEGHDNSLKRLTTEHRERIALLEQQFLQQKHQKLRAQESALWEMEEKHIHEKHQLAKRQLKDIFFLQRHQLPKIERGQLPKRIKQEMKTRELMFRESLRISASQLPDYSPEEGKDKVKKFQDNEKRRYEAQRKRAEMKYQKQLEELQAASESTAKELEQMQNEKRKMLMEHETYKLKAQDDEYHRELKEWRANLIPRKQKLEDTFERELVEQKQFYGSYLNQDFSSSLDAALHRQSSST